MLTLAAGARPALLGAVDVLLRLSCGEQQGWLWGGVGLLLGEFGGGSQGVLKWGRHHGSINNPTPHEEPMNTQQTAGHPTPDPAKGWNSQTDELARELAALGMKVSVQHDEEGYSHLNFGV